MPRSINVTVFGGLRPKIHSVNRNSRYGGGLVEFAEEAVDTYLHGTDLRGYSQDTLVVDAGYRVRSIHKLAAHTCCNGMYLSPKCVDTTELGALKCGEWEHVIEWQNECSGRHLRVNPCTGDSYLLTVDAPVTPPQITLGVSATLEARQCGPYAYQDCAENIPADGCNVDYLKGPDEIVYLTTYVDQFGVESPPGPPSRAVAKWDDQPATLTGIAINPPANAACVRIYRTSSSFNTDPKTQNISFDTTYQLVAELAIPVVNNTFVDDRRLHEIAWGTLITMEDCPPPECMVKVEYMPTGNWCGFRGNDLYVSEKHEFWNWPEQLRISVPDRITGMAVFGDIIFLGTTGVPYRVRLDFKVLRDGKFETDIVVAPYGEKYPCLQHEAMVATGWGAAYVSAEGIVGLQPAGVASLMTRHRVDPEQWARYAPNQLAWWDGFLIGVRTPTSHALLLDFAEKGEGGRVEFGDMHTFRLQADVIHSGYDGRLYYSRGSNVYTFGTGRERKPYRWRSRVFRMDGLMSMGAAQVFGEYGRPVTFRLWVDGRLAHEQTFRSNEPCRLPPHCRGREYQFEIESDPAGSTTITEVHIAPSVRELAGAARPAPAMAG